MIKLLKLKPLLKEMRTQKNTKNINGIEVVQTQVAATFDYKNGKTEFSVVFYDLQPMILTFVKKGTTPPEFLSVAVNDDFTIKTDFNKETEKYKLLVKMLELEFKKGEPFSPNSFFFDFSQKIPTYMNTKKYNQHETTEHFQEYIAIEESEKTKFLRFQANYGNRNPTLENLSKTRLYFGNDEAYRCKVGRISSCWGCEDK